MNIIVCSCGSPLVGEALARLRQRHPGEGKRLWLFPPDYLECLERSLLKEMPYLRRQPGPAPG